MKPGAMSYCTPNLVETLLSSDFRPSAISGPPATEAGAAARAPGSTLRRNQAFICSVV